MAAGVAVGLRDARIAARKHDGDVLAFSHLARLGFCVLLDRGLLGCGLLG
jgi:hypothetical protein